MEFVSHLDKKLLLPWLLDGMLCELNVHDAQKSDYWTFLKVRWVPSSLNSLPDILKDMEESYWQTANKGKTVFQISCIMEKSVRYYGPVGSRWMPQYFRTLSDCPGSKMALSILEIWKLLTMHFLLALVIFYPSGAFGEFKTDSYTFC